MNAKQLQCKCNVQTTILERPLKLNANTRRDTGLQRCEKKQILKGKCFLSFSRNHTHVENLAWNS